MISQAMISKAKLTLGLFVYRGSQIENSRELDAPDCPFVDPQFGGE